MNQENKTSGRKGLLFPTRSYITNTYDGNARLTATFLKTSGNTALNSHAYGYNVGNQLTNMTATAGNYWSYGYDNAGQLLSAIGKESGGTTRLQEQFGYKYDAAGNLNQRTNNALIQTFTANNLNQLSSASRSGTLTVSGTSSSSATSVTVNGNAASRYSDATFAAAGFSLANGNNTFEAIAADSLGRNATNAITVNLHSSPSYTYDNNGNMTADGALTYDYDDENQLIRVTSSNAWKSEFTYDGKMRLRIRKEYLWKSSSWKLSSETRYIYDGMLVIEERDGNNYPRITYTRDPDLGGGLHGAGGIGGLPARKDWSVPYAESHAYYHADGNGNITTLIDDHQTIKAKYTYDPYGNTLSQMGPLADANVYRFSSKEYQRNSGLYSYGYRFYSPNCQRWLNRDPIADKGFLARGERARNIRYPLLESDSLSLYHYVFNSPVTKIDPLGLSPASDCYDACDAALQADYAACRKRWPAVGAGIGATLGAGAGALIAGPAGFISCWFPATAGGVIGGAAGAAAGYGACAYTAGFQNSQCNYSCLFAFGL